MNDHVAPPLVPAIDFQKRTEQFVRLRDKIREIKEKQKAELKPYNEALGTLGNMLLDHLNQIGVESVRADAGTPHKIVERSAAIADKEAFWNWIVTQGKWEFLDYKANVTAVHDYLEEQLQEAKENPTIVPAPPPGVNYTERYKIGVLRGKETHK
jgi:hypothetical protein